MLTLCWLLVSGCKPDAVQLLDSTPTDPPPVDPPITDTAATIGQTDTGPASDTGPTVVEEVYDCANLPELAQPAVMLDAPRGYNDLVFDVDGAMIGNEGDNLVKATSAVDSTLYLPGVRTLHKMGLLDGGDIVAVRNPFEGGGIVRVTPGGGTTVMATPILGYGLDVGSDGNVYVGPSVTDPFESVMRIDPDTGDFEVMLDPSPDLPRALAFNRDYTRLYYGTHFGGRVFGVDLDANLDPVGAPELLATLDGDWHDTVEVDACGNVYVGAMGANHNLYRIHTDGRVQVLADWSFETFGHGFKWGSAAGGWDDHALYVVHPDQGFRVSEFVVGVPGAHWPGVVVGGGTL